MPVVAILAQGAMGAGIAGRLVENGVEVMTCLEGRSAASRARAEAAGMRDAPLETLAQADVFLSIVPPRDAADVAARLAPLLARAARKAVYVDCNAVAVPRVERIAADRFFHVHASQITREHGGRAQVGFAVGKHRKLYRETARFDDAALDVFGDLAEVRIARCQFRPGITDTDNRLALKFMIGNTLILHPAAVHETVLISRAKPR
eukprot:gene39567-48248_t